MTAASPAWVPYSFAVLMIVVSAYCVGRLAVAASRSMRNRYDVTVAHALMGLGMVGMLVPGWHLRPIGLWVCIFAGLAAYFLVRAVAFVRVNGLIGSDRGHVHHVTHALVHMVMALAMLYMYWLAAASPTRTVVPSAMAGPPRGAGDPSLTLVLLVVLAASAVWELDGIGRFAPLRLTAQTAGVGPAMTSPEPTAAIDRWLAPRLEVWCHIAMCVTMGYMLVLAV